MIASYKVHLNVYSRQPQYLTIYIYSFDLVICFNDNELVLITFYIVVKRERTLLSPWAARLYRNSNITRATYTVLYIDIF